MSRSPRIAIDARHIGQYGIGRYIRELLAALPDLEGDETYVAITGPQRDHMVPRNERIEIVHDSTGVYSPRGLVSVGRKARRCGADVFHATHYVVPLTRIPVVTTIHDLIHLRLPKAQISAPKRFYAHHMIRRACRSSRQIITPTSAVRNEIVERYGIDRRSTRAIHHGIDTKRFSPDPSPREREPFLLYVGNDQPHKNLVRLVEAFSLLRNQFDSLQLVLAGKTFDQFTGLPGVRVEGHITDQALVDLFRRATAHVLPSVLEGFGMPVLEAMACGTPVAASDIPALREVAGDAARFFDPFSIDSIASVLAELVRDQELRERLSIAGTTRAAEFSWQAAASETLETYRRALER